MEQKNFKSNLNLEQNFVQKKIILLQQILVILWSKLLAIPIALVTKYLGRFARYEVLDG